MSRKPKPRFKNLYASPPGGVYVYTLNGVTVQGTTTKDIARKAAALRRKAGLVVFGDGFVHVMEQMCPNLPDGFCTEPSNIKVVEQHKAQAKTQALFDKRLLPMDEIQRRIEICRTCPEHQRRGFCPECTGLNRWVYRGFRGRRPELPQDITCGACPLDGYMVVASASVADLPPEPGVEYPEHCWRQGDDHG